MVKHQEKHLKHAINILLIGQKFSIIWFRKHPIIWSMFSASLGEVSINCVCLFEKPKKVQWRQACTQEICRFSSDCSSTWICLRLQKMVHQNNTAARNCNMEICPWRHSNISKACEMQWFGWSCFLLRFAARSLGGWHRWYLNKSPFCAVLYLYFHFTTKKNVSERNLYQNCVATCLFCPSFTFNIN